MVNGIPSIADLACLESNTDSMDWTQWLSDIDYTIWYINDYGVLCLLDERNY